MKNNTHLQEQYADEMTSFLEYAKDDDIKNAENVKYIIKVLDEFYVLSGLGINKSKTQLSLFGCDLEKLELAKSLGLKWCHKFTMLGIDFDQCLLEMDQKFEIRSQNEILVILKQKWLEYYKNFIVLDSIENIGA